MIDEKQKEIKKMFNIKMKGMRDRNYWTDLSILIGQATNLAAEFKEKIGPVKETQTGPGSMTRIQAIENLNQAFERWFDFLLKQRQDKDLQDKFDNYYFSRRIEDKRDLGFNPIYKEQEVAQRTDLKAPSNTSKPPF